MKVLLIYRNRGFSIERVFSAVRESLESDYNVAVSEVRLFRCRFWLMTILKNLFYCAFLSQRKKYDVYHITGDVQYCGVLMNKNNTILTIHDVVPLVDGRVRKPLRFLIYWLWYYLPLKHLHYITCISESTKNDIIRFFPWAEKKLRVIHNPVDSKFVKDIKEFNQEKARILHIGTKPNKNLENVVPALSGLSCHLRVIGKLTEEQLHLLEKSDIDYSNAFNLDDEQILEEYRKCDLVSFPSLFEGFGMPIIEAQAIGRPILTSCYVPMSDVAGDGACLVEPRNIESIRTGFGKIISDKEFRDKIVHIGFNNVERFLPRTITRKYLDIYEFISRRG